MGWEQHAGTFLDGLAHAGTRRVYRQTLREYIGLGRPDMEAWRSTMLQRGNSPATVNRKLAALRAFFNFLIERGLADRNPARLSRPMKLARRTRPAVTADQVDALVAVCDDRTPAGARDKAIILLTALEGLRRTQIARLTSEATIGNGAIGHAVEAWKARSPAPLRDGAPLFTSLSNNGRGRPRELSGYAVNLIVKKRAAQAGLTGLTTRTLRRFARNGGLR